MCLTEFEIRLCKILERSSFDYERGTGVTARRNKDTFKHLWWRFFKKSSTAFNWSKIPNNKLMSQSNLDNSSRSNLNSILELYYGKDGLIGRMKRGWLIQDSLSISSYIHKVRPKICNFRWDPRPETQDPISGWAPKPETQDSKNLGVTRDLILQVTPKTRHPRRCRVRPKTRNPRLSKFRWNSRSDTLNDRRVPRPVIQWEPRPGNIRIKVFQNIWWKIVNFCKKRYTIFQKQSSRGVEACVEVSRCPEELQASCLQLYSKRDSGTGVFLWVLRNF